MNKIIEIKEDIIGIGMKNGELIHVRKIDLNFEPRMGDIVEVYQNTEKTTVVLSHGNLSGNPYNNNENNSGININISNDNSNKNIGDYYIQSGTVVNKIVYCLLAFFLGGIGAHKFYAGKFGKGFLYLVFCWTLIPTIISLIECIIAITKKEDPNGNILV